MSSDPAPTPMRVVIVRHAEPLVAANQPSQDWDLTLKGRADSADLAQRLSALPLERLVSSTETKAVETARIIADVVGVPTSADTGLNETRRPWLDEGFEQTVIRYLAGHPTPAWEPLEAVRRRMARVVDDFAGEGLVALVTHGTAMTAWLAARTTIDASTFWAELRLPDAWLVDGSMCTRL